MTIELVLPPLSSIMLLIQSAEATTTSDASNCFIGIPTIVGTDNDDVIQGTEENDCIIRLGGNDRILGKGGNDKLCGGDDLLHGGSSNDFGDGGPNFDTCVTVETVRNCEAQELVGTTHTCKPQRYSK
jgi:hypothetical protein